MFIQSGWTAGHVARHQHYLNIFDVLRRVTTSVESWEEIETYEEEIGRYVRTTVESSHLIDNSELEGEAYGLPLVAMARLQLERPDVMGEHPVTDTEEDQGGSNLLLL